MSSISAIVGLFYAIIFLIIIGVTGSLIHGIATIAIAILLIFQLVRLYLVLQNPF